MAEHRFGSWEEYEFWQKRSGHEWNPGDTIKVGGNVFIQTRQGRCDMEPRKMNVREILKRWVDDPECWWIDSRESGHLFQIMGIRVNKDTDGIEIATRFSDGSGSFSRSEFIFYSGLYAVDPPAPPKPKLCDATLSKKAALEAACSPYWREKVEELFGDRDEIQVWAVIGLMNSIAHERSNELRCWMADNALVHCVEYADFMPEEPTGKSM